MDGRHPTSIQVVNERPQRGTSEQPICSATHLPGLAPINDYRPVRAQVPSEGRTPTEPTASLSRLPLSASRPLALVLDLESRPRPQRSRYRSTRRRRQVKLTSLHRLRDNLPALADIDVVLQLSG